MRLCATFFLLFLLPLVGNAADVALPPASPFAFGEWQPLSGQGTEKPAAPQMPVKPSLSRPVAPAILPSPRPEATIASSASDDADWEHGPQEDAWLSPRDYLGSYHHEREIRIRETSLPMPQSALLPVDGENAEDADAAAASPSLAAKEAAPATSASAPAASDPDEDLLGALRRAVQDIGATGAVPPQPASAQTPPAAATE